MFPGISLSDIPGVPLGDWVEFLVSFTKKYFGSFLELTNNKLDDWMGICADALLQVSPILLILIMVGLIWYITRKPGVAIGSGIGLLLTLNLHLWNTSIETLVLVLVATFFALLLGLPLGILTSWSNTVHKIVMPILDFMQTMPPFVYLVPAVILIGIGQVPALLATVIFAMPPVIRLTGLGIRQVPLEFLEAAEAFGSTRIQKLVKVQLPLALPTIMAGVNQCIMLSLSMVVIAAMIGAGGLGSEVLRGLQRLDIPKGFEGGLAIVIMAIILDRVTQSLGRQKQLN